MLKKTLTLLLAFVLLFAFCGSAMAAEEKSEKDVYRVVVKLIWIDLDQPTYSLHRQYWEYINILYPESPLPMPPIYYALEHLTSVDHIMHVPGPHEWQYIGGEYLLIHDMFTFYGHGMHDIGAWQMVPAVHFR